MGQITEQLEILVSSGVGEGPTSIAAFHAALTDAGVAGFNIIPLSSVIPEGATVARGSPTAAGRGSWGDRLYAVIADCRVSRPGLTAAAGLGWWQDPSGRGVFVEYIGASESEVQADLLSSLRSIYDTRGGPLATEDEPELFTISASIRCRALPVCAVAVASYTVTGWQGTS